MGAEIWKPIEGYEGYYEVSDMGRVRGLDRVTTDRRGIQQRRLGRVLTPWYQGRPGRKYPWVDLRSDGKRTRSSIHRLVTAAFIGPYPDGKEVNHKNGITTDNHLENLEYVTHSENIRHAIDTLGATLGQAGEDHHNAKLSAKQVCNIRSRYASGGVTQQELANQNDVAVMTVNDILCSRTWNHLPEEREYPA